MKQHIALLASLFVLCSTAAVAQEFVPTPVTISTEKVKLNGKVYYAHLVLERQTLYSIAKAYNVTEGDLYEANPSLRETGLQKSSVLLIPVDKQKVTEKPVAQPAKQPVRQEAQAPAPATQEPQGEYKEHTVRWYEDLEDIARRYNVTAQEIIDYNHLKSRKLTTRQVLRIPLGGAVAPKVEQPVQAEEEVAPVIEFVPTTAEEVQEEAVDSTLFLGHPKDVVDFSLLLPLKVGNTASELNMDFYSGVLMAVKDLEAQGLKVQMHVNDLYAGMPDVDALCRSDFVLGPVATRDIEVMLQLIEGRVPVISPLDQKAAGLSAGYRNFIQAPTGTDNQYEDLAQWIQEDLAEGDKVLFIAEKNASNVQAAVNIRTAMARRELTYQILNYAIADGRAVPDSLAPMMVKNGVNRVVVASESEAFVGDAVRNLTIMLGKGYDVVMYAPSKVRNFDSIDGTALHDVSAHISTAYHVNYGSPEVDSFVRSYRALFRTEPSQFAFQGYDTACYFVQRVARYGSVWTGKLGLELNRGLHTDFLFESDDNDNRRNIAVRRIVYKPDYTTILLQ
ncbi:MAG: LysM peptidoglycan-binding domain-containing protein [Bacteroidales bacterium]|jgi:LysM repeat protein|nr:LysM peptidoglycan-binding domain-containing protein [Bacteroidales bacterium]